MKLDKYKIREKKLGFIILCAIFIVGALMIFKIADFFTETAEIGATVVHTYDTPYNRFTHNPGGPKMNIEWVDLNGEVQTEGSLSNDTGLKEGDIFTIYVDAKTRSRTVYSKAGCVFTFVSGILLCAVSIRLMIFFYGKSNLSR